MTLPSTPAIVGAVADPHTLSSLPSLDAAVASCDLLEFRLDALPENPRSIDEALAASPLPTLITVRDPAEGGLGDLSPLARAERMHAALPHARFIDIELRNLEERPFAPVRQEARERGIGIIASFHDFEATPPPETLLNAVAHGRQLGADLVKIAVTLNTPSDLITLLQLLDQEKPNGPLAVMGMGPLGMGSRILLAQCGSLLTYAYLQEANAPGQWPATTMRQIFQDLGLDRAHLPSL